MFVEFYLGKYGVRCTVLQFLMSTQVGPGDICCPLYLYYLYCLVLSCLSDLASYLVSVCDSPCLTGSNKKWDSWKKFRKWSKPLHRTISSSHICEDGVFNLFACKRPRTELLRLNQGIMSTVQVNSVLIWKWLKVSDCWRSNVTLQGGDGGTEQCGVSYLDSLAS